MGALVERQYDAGASLEKRDGMEQCSATADKSFRHRLSLLFAGICPVPRTTMTPGFLVTRWGWSNLVEERV